MLAKIIAIILLSLVSQIIEAQHAESINTCDGKHCIGVVDAGSTGSRFNIYAYDYDKTNTPTHIQLVWSNTIEPGFASLQPRKKMIANYLTQLFSGIESQKPIPVYFYATAGMRLHSRPKQALFYHHLKTWFAHQSQYKLKCAKTITGREEGVFAWLSINYQLGILSNPLKMPVGIMDMGGASVQVVFPVEKDKAIKESGVYYLNVYNRSFKLFVSSFLGLGQTVLSHQFLDIKSCFPNGYELPSGYFAKGQAFECSERVNTLINRVQHVDEVVPKALSKSQARNWYVLGGLQSLVTDEIYDFQNKTFTVKQLIDLTNQKICQQDWKKLMHERPTDEYFFGFCLHASYYYALIVHGYGIEPTQKLHFLPSSQKSSWTLGVVLHQP